MEQTITRRITIGAVADDVWSQIGDDDGLAGWLAPDVVVDVSPGSAGCAVDDDGRVRRMVVTEVDAGSRLGFVWWHEDRPDDPSRVEVTLHEVDGATTVTVTETRVPSSDGHANLTADQVAGARPTGDRVSGAGGIGGRAAGWAEACVDGSHLGGEWDGRLGRLLLAVDRSTAAVSTVW